MDGDGCTVVCKARMDDCVALAGLWGGVGVEDAVREKGTMELFTYREY